MSQMLIFPCGITKVDHIFSDHYRIKAIVSEVKHSCHLALSSCTSSPIYHPEARCEQNESLT